MEDKKGTQNKGNKLKIVMNIVAIISTTSIITLNVNGLNTPTKLKTETIRVDQKR